MKNALRIAACLLLVSFFTAAPSAWAQSAHTSGKGAEPPSGDAELARELSNPLADLMTIPIPMNYDSDIGPLDDGWKLQANIQPVIPFSLNANWNLISRTIIPAIDQEDIFPGAGHFRSAQTLLNPSEQGDQCHFEKRRTQCETSA